MRHVSGIIHVLRDFLLNNHFNVICIQMVYFFLNLWLFSTPSSSLSELTDTPQCTSLKPPVRQHSLWLFLQECCEVSR